MISLLLPLCPIFSDYPDVSTACDGNPPVTWCVEQLQEVYDIAVARENKRFSDESQRLREHFLDLINQGNDQALEIYSNFQQAEIRTHIGKLQAIDDVWVLMVAGQCCPDKIASNGTDDATTLFNLIGVEKELKVLCLDGSEPDPTCLDFERDVYDNLVNQLNKDFSDSSIRMYEQHQKRIEQCGDSPECIEAENMVFGMFSAQACRNHSENLAFVLDVFLWSVRENCCQ